MRRSKNASGAIRKGCTRRARRGDLLNFTGIDSAYEPPESPEIRLDTVASTAEECVGHILSTLYPNLGSVRQA